MDLRETEELLQEKERRLSELDLEKDRTIQEIKALTHYFNYLLYGTGNYDDVEDAYDSIEGLSEIVKKYRKPYRLNI